MSKPQILIVDDSLIDLNITAECLSDKFAVNVANSGAKAIDLIKQGRIKPVVILLDVSMPETDGYETCKRIFDLVPLFHFEVIFLSANNAPADRLKGYEVGGSAYLGKPCIKEELVRNVSIAVARCQEIESAVEQSHVATETAMTAISDSGEQASVLHFLRESFDCNSIQSLAALIVESCEYFELQSSVQIKLPWELILQGSKPVVSGLEKELLRAISESDKRIHQHGRRLVLNYAPLSLLIKNLPIEDDEKCGRFRDHLALIMEGAKSRLVGLMAKFEMQSLMDETNENINVIQELQASNKQNSVRIMDDLSEEIQTSFLNYGLTEEQESALLELVEKYLNRLLQSYEEGLEVDEKFKAINQRLATALKRSHEGEVNYLNQNLQANGERA